MNLDKGPTTHGLVYHMENGKLEGTLIPLTLENKLKEEFKERGLINLSTKEINDFLERNK